MSVAAGMLRSMWDLSNRELATGILLLAGLALILILPSWRRSIGPSLADLVRTLLARQLLLLFALYAIYTAALVLLAAKVGAWDTTLLKDTIFIWLFFGFPLLMNAHEMRSGERFLRASTSKILGVGAFLAFYVGLEPLPVWAELLLQPFAALLAGIAAVGHHNDDPDHQRVARFLDGLLGLLGLALIAHTTWQAVHTWDGKRLAEVGTIFGLGIWLGFALVPFMYVVAYFMRIEQIWVVLPFFNDRQPPPRRVLLALVVGLRMRVYHASRFDGPWRRQLSQTTTLRAALTVLRKFRRQGSVTETGTDREVQVRSTK